MKKTTRQRLSLIYFLQFTGTFIFLFLIVSIICLILWRKLGTDDLTAKRHIKFQIETTGVLIVGAIITMNIPHDLTQLILAYVLIFFNLARAGYGGYLLRKYTRLSPQKSSSRTLE